MKKGYFIYFLLFVVFSSCKEQTNNSQHVAANKSIATTDKSNEPVKQEIHNTAEFIRELQEQPIQPLPFSFASFLMDSLNNETRYDEIIFKVAFQEIDSTTVLNNLNTELNYHLSIQDIHDDTEPYAPFYYSILLEGNCDCTLSNSYLYKRLPSLNNQVEVLLLSTKIVDEPNDFTRGVIFELVTYNTVSTKVINRKRVLTAGIGREDTRYIEGFRIGKDYAIEIKSYMGLEDESTTIERKMRVLPDGSIEEGKANVVIEDHEIEYEAPQH